MTYTKELIVTAILITVFLGLIGMGLIIPSTLGMHRHVAVRVLTN